MHFNRLAGADSTSRDYPGVAATSTFDRTRQIRADRIEHLAWLADLGDLKLHASVEAQPITDVEYINIEAADCVVFAGCAGLDFEPLSPQIVKIFDIDQADSLHLGVVLGVIVPVADEAG